MSFDDWQKVKLEDAPLQIIDGDRGVNYPKQQDFSSQGYCLFLNTGNVTSTGFNFTSCLFISKEKENTLRKGKLNRNDIVLTTRGTIGNVAIFSNNIKYENIRINSGMVIIRSEKTKILPIFLYFFLTSSLFIKQVKSLSSGSAQPQLPIRDMKQIFMPLPPLPIQKEIATILSSLDNRISLLRETNTTLEAIAQTLFKSWFVDFDPVKAKVQGKQPEGMDEATAAMFPSEFEESALGLIPKGWSNVSLKEVVSIFDSQRVPLSGGDRAKRKGNYPYYGAASLMDYIDGYIFDGVYCLMGEDGSVAHESGYPIIQYVWGKIWVNNHAHVLQGKNGISTEHVMLSLQRTNIQPLITGAVQAKLSQGNMWRIIFLMPSTAIAEVFGEMIAPLFTRIRHNFEKIQTLTTLRDTLLPRLISGQLRINQAQDVINEVGA